MPKLTNIFPYHVQHSFFPYLQVFIPCELNHQGFVIVANFNKKSFDVLTSDYRSDNYLQSVNTVIYNFKCLFMTSFPTFKQFNICDFEPSLLKCQNKPSSMCHRTFSKFVMVSILIYMKCCFVSMQI
jgi:hypothetical protein